MDFIFTDHGTVTVTQRRDEHCLGKLFETSDVWLWDLGLAGLGVPGTWCEGRRSSHMRSIGLKCFWWEGGCGGGNRLHNFNHSYTVIFTHTVPHSNTHSYTLTDTHPTESHLQMSSHILIHTYQNSYLRVQSQSQHACTHTITGIHIVPLPDK